MKNTILSLFALLFFAQPLTMSVYAQADSVENSTARTQDTRLEEIIVTAQKREEILQDVPISIVSVTGKKLQDAGINKIDELQSYIPNLTVSETGIGTLLFMRGIGSGINQGFEQSVGTYVDGIYRGRAQQSRMPFLDINRIEVLRGPQSILFGKHTIAGALNISTAKPTNYLDAQLSSLYEPVFNESQISGHISGPLSDTVNGRLAAYVRNSDGWMKNLTLDRREAQRDEYVVRGTLDWNVNDDFDLSLKVETSKFDAIGRQMEIIEDRTAQAGPFTGMNYGTVLQSLGQDSSVTNTGLDFNRSSNGDFSNNEAHEIVLTANYYGWGDLTLTSISGLSTYDYDELCDCDYTGADIFTARFKEDYDQFSQEFRLVSPGNRVFDYILGLSYLSSNLNFTDSIFVTPNSVLVPIVESRAGPGAGGLIANTATPRRLDQETSTLALYGQGTWDYSEATRFAFGARVIREERDATRQLMITDISFNPLPSQTDSLVQNIYSGLFNISPHKLTGKWSKTRFLPSFNIQHDINQEVMAYVTLSRGEKSGGFDARSNNAPENGGSFEFQGELADTIEIGSKMSLAGGSAELNAALYFTEFDRMQVSTFDGVLGFNVGNAARAQSRGLELDGRWQLTDKLRLSGSLAFSDFEFKEYYGQCYFGQVADAPDGINCDYAGRTNQFVADYSGTFTVDYRKIIANNLTLNIVLDAIYSDDYLLTATQDPRAVQDRYAKFNGRISLTSADEHWEVALIGTNLSDRKIKSFAGNVPLAGTSFGAPGFYAFVEQPRSVAASLSYRY